jgi:hypothetical protein
MSENPELDLWPIQPYLLASAAPFIGCISSSHISHEASIWSFCRSKGFALV